MRIASCAPISAWCRRRCAPTSIGGMPRAATLQLSVVQARPRRRSPTCRCRGRSSRSSSTARGSRACTCAWAYVARGGIRWSDRREDFRTEVLGLMKAQNVKNTLIVPVGAKGGFVPKRLPGGGTREEIQAEVIACYQTFIRGLLDLTDNIVGGAVVPPPQVVRRDGDDPYLVVAADKGTATFSDIANAISADYGFWLGDAFASGGSAGYDHKKMGITARGAWECVKRHFRELGIDIQKTAFTVDRHRRHVGRRVRQRHAALAPHPPAGRLRPPPHLPRPGPGCRRRASPSGSACLRCRARAGTTTIADAISQAAAACSRAPPSRSRCRREARALLGLRVSDRSSERDHARHPAHAGRPAVERRHRHLRQGERRAQRRGRRPRQRCGCASTAGS